MDRWPDHRPASPLIGAHRGDCAHWPENSRAAFASAIAAGADFIETDLRLTADGVPVACHDPDFARLGGDARRVADLTLAQARALHPAICTIDEVAAQVLPHALLLLDIKLTEADGMTAMARALAAIPAGERTALGLRSLDAVRILHALLPGWPRLGLFADPADYPAFAAVGGIWARLWQRDASAAQIAHLQSLGLNVVIMTGQPTAQSVGVIDPATLADLMHRTPDAVMLNDPGLAVRAIRPPLSTPRDEES